MTKASNTSNPADKKPAKRAPAPAVTNPPQLVLTPALRGDGALFNVPTEDRTESGPLMRGQIRDADGRSISVSMFRETSEAGVVYASLALGSENQTHWYGKLFRTDTAEGPHYSGYLSVLPVDKADQYTPEQWELAPRLQVCGWRRRSAGGDARIALAIAPKLVAADELAF